MKTVYFVRHAKSSWSEPGLADHDRPLNNRGKRDAPRMADWLISQQEVPDLLLSSTAKRAKTTAKVFAEALGYNRDRILLDKRLYHAYPEAIMEVIRELPNDFDRLAVFAHNPGLTMLANYINGAYIDNVPTTGIVATHCAVNTWQEWDLETTERFGFWFPKML